MPTKSGDDDAKGDKRFVDVGAFCYSVSAVLRVGSFTDTAQRVIFQLKLALYCSPLCDQPLEGNLVIYHCFVSVKAVFWILN